MTKQRSQQQRQLLHWLMELNKCVCLILRSEVHVCEFEPEVGREAGRQTKDYCNDDNSNNKQLTRHMSLKLACSRVANANKDKWSLSSDLSLQSAQTIAQRIQKPKGRKKERLFVSIELKQHFSLRLRVMRKLQLASERCRSACLTPQKVNGNMPHASGALILTR